MLAYAVLASRCEILEIVLFSRQELYPIVYTLFQE